VISPDQPYNDDDPDTEPLMFYTGRRFQQDNEYREFLRRAGTGVRRFRVMHVDGWIIDATDDAGCIARHIQCAMSSDAADANCMIAVDPKGRGVGIFATRIIDPGEELVSNYVPHGMFELFRGSWLSWGLDELEDTESNRVADRAPVFLQRNVRSVQRTLPDGHMMPQMATSHQLPGSLTLALRECQSSVAIAGLVQEEIDAFSSSLDPDAVRILKWGGESEPRICGVPWGSEGDQPFYGAYSSHSADPVFANSSLQSDAGGHCLLEPWANPVEEFGGRQVCLSSIRNNPQEGWSPAFVAWPVTSEHVASAVRFATQHSLCVMVAGTVRPYK
jgi:hypothetical protein